MTIELGNHCWHWSRLSDALRIPMEECCNCDKVIEEIQRWDGTDNGKCEWKLHD